jgi:hypothetical protein
VWTERGGAAYGRWPSGGWWGLRPGPSAEGRRFNNRPQAQAYALGRDEGYDGVAVSIPLTWLALRAEEN